MGLPLFAAGAAAPVAAVDGGADVVVEAEELFVAGAGVRGPIQLQEMSCKRAL